ncbi:MAG: DUF3306 domain-containing protein [Pseudomonadota bacterium]
MSAGDDKRTDVAADATADGEGFLGRWSRRKSEARDEPEHAPAEADAAAAEDETDEQADAPEDDFSDVDFEALNADSDFTRFMGDGVPDDVRTQALAKLWTSDPAFAKLDGLLDYSEDFSDAATVPVGAMRTAYKVGQGFLNDEEVAEWEALGRETKPGEGPVEDAVGPKIVGAVIGVESPLQDDVRALFAASDAYASALYPAESNHPVSPEALASAGAIFHVARARGAAVGCGALLVAKDRTSELKRMWVDPDARGGGLGRRLLDGLLAEAQIRDVEVVRLETGVKQEAAVALYRKSGFTDCAAFGSYREDPNSLFLERRLKDSD